MSPRAALRLEHFGFEQAYDYVPGKTDWMAAGLPREGQSASVLYAGDVARERVPTCLYTDRVSEALERMQAEGQDFCVVTDEQKTVFGIVETGSQPVAGADATAADVMRSGPTTVRANEPLQDLVERMERAGVGGIPVTDPEGRLLGFLFREDAERALQERREQ